MTKDTIITAIGRPGRLVVARLLPGQDVVEGIVAIVKKNQINSCCVTAIGSLRSAKVVWAGSMEFGDNPMDVAVFYEMEGPVELGSAHGICGTDTDGQVVMHLHAQIMDHEGNMRCGNLIAGSSPVLATVELTIQEFDGVTLKPTMDNGWKHKFLHPMATDEH